MNISMFSTKGMIEVLLTTATCEIYCEVTLRKVGTNKPIRVSFV